MGSGFGRLHVMINPRAGRGSMKDLWPRLESFLAEQDLDVAPTFTERAGHATEATRQAIEDGATYIVAVGGDGTIHEVVNGMMGQDKPLNPDAVLGVIPGGSGCDFVRTFGLPQDPLDAARHLTGDGLWGRLDVARVTYASTAGGTGTRWFANVGEAGLGAAVVARASRMPRWLGGSVYRFAALREILALRPTSITLAMHGRKARGVRVDTPLEEMTHTGLCDLLIVANGQFFGGGMKVAPRAIPEDGLLDVLLASDLNRREAIGLMQKMFKAAHVPNPKVAEFLADRVEVTTDRPLTVEVDGEVLGTTPATFDVVAGAIPFKI
jgi:diacylglycerol kinase (ATP)